MSFRFGPDVRLRSSEEFKAIQQRGRRVAAKYVTVLGRPNGLGRDRLGITASRRVGGAVVRNRAKRQIRDVFRRQEPDRAIDRYQAGMDVVVIVRSDFVAATFAAIEADVTGAIGRLRPLRTK